MTNLYRAALNKVCKWRSVFAGWQLGTRPIGDPESDAVRDHRELSILLRVEVTALIRLCIEKGICTEDEFHRTMAEEAEYLSLSFEKKFPGFQATETGMSMDPVVAQHTMKGWRP